MTTESENHPEKTGYTPTRRETWAYRIALGAMAVFTVMGFYLFYNPSDALETAYVLMLIVTLGLGLLAGIVAVYS
ncbi:MAG: hypothetical protein HY866_09965 [Chloroflexi bacterium]|nr:hypothetical protein [Chloroflexota bacterium]